MPKTEKTLMKRWAIGLAFALTIAILGGAAQAQQGSFGTTAAPASLVATAQLTAQSVLGNVSPSRVWKGTDYETGGTGIRNQGAGGITIAGVTGKVVAAYLYWAVITQGPPNPHKQGKQWIQREGGTGLYAGKPTLVVGTAVGTGGSPCWPGDRLTVYRAPVPLWVVGSGNGFYEVIPVAGSVSSTAGQDPWEPPPLGSALEEGKSLVVIYESAPDMVTELYDTGLAGTLYISGTGLSYSNALTFPSAGGYVKWDNITADGQKGQGRLASFGLGDEATYLDGVQVAGPGSPANDSDQNGNDSTPVPSLWDTRGHLVVGSVGDDGLIDVIIASVSGGGDCLNAVANVVNYRVGVPAAATK
jgi:hypothetical protein